MRTYTLVGVSSALVMLVSKYGFTNVLDAGKVVVDPSRVAAQIVSGIGFIGGGLIFVRKDIVRGLTTAATVWLVAAVGMACGAGLPVLAVAVTGVHFIVMFIFPAVERRLPKSRWAPSSLWISYEDGRGVLREVLEACTRSEFSVSNVRIERDPLRQGDGQTEGSSAPAVVMLYIEVRGAKSLPKLIARLSSISGVLQAQTGDPDRAADRERVDATRCRRCRGPVDRPSTLAAPVGRPLFFRVTHSETGLNLPTLPSGSPHAASIAMAVASPPPMQSEATPRLRPRALQRRSA